MIYPIERSSQRAVLACGVIFSVLAIAAVVLRIVARRIAHRKLDSSDWLMVAACVCTVGFQATTMSEVIIGGSGFHLSEIAERFQDPTMPQTFLKHLFATQIEWAVCLGLAKVSMLVLYAKIFPSKTFRIVSRLIAVFMVVWVIATIINDLLICHPVQFQWEQTIPGGYCGDIVKGPFITGIANVVTDVVVLVLPMPYLYRLKLERYKKMVMMCVFGVGAVTVFVSIYRVITLTSVGFEDITYNIFEASLMSALEPCLSIVVGCVPLMRPLLGRSKYSKNGTVQYQYNHDSTARPGANPRRFKQLQEESSVSQLRPDDPYFLATAVGGDENGDHDHYHTELGVINVKRELVVGDHAV